MAAFNHEGSFIDVDMTEHKPQETDQLAFGKTDNSIVNRNKLKACSAEKGIRFVCKECGETNN